MSNYKLKLTVMILAAILFMILIIGPEINSIEASTEPDNLPSEEITEPENLPKDPLPGGENGDNNASQSGIEEHEGEKTTESGIDVIYESDYPNVPLQLKYQLYPITYTYVLIENPEVSIRKGPSIEEPVIKKAVKNEKLSYIETVINDQKWYHVTWKDNEIRKFGFASSDAVTKRVFQFDKMYAMIQVAEEEFAKGKLTYIDNYKNRKGKAPAYNSGELDREGNRRSQSAPGYPDLNNKKEFTYIGDGTLVRILSADSYYTKVSLVHNARSYYVPNKYVSPPVVNSIKKVIAIDRKNQNEVVFEKIGNDWTIVSYTLATTGKVGPYHQPTPLGYYYAIEKRERFYYYKDGTTIIQGYAPYAVRFAGGAYVHGVAVDYKYDKQGKKIDPGKIEYSRSVGTVPLSHKCVRNYTSHAKFLYDWYSPGETIVVVIE